MGKVLIVGCGGVASVAVHKCCQNSKVFDAICIASRTVSKCEALKEKLQDSLEPSATGFMRIEPEPCGGGVRVPFGARDTRRINPGLGGIGIEPGMGAIVKRD